jgi:cell division protein FtsB
MEDFDVGTEIRVKLTLLYFGLLLEFGNIIYQVQITVAADALLALVYGILVYKQAYM